jgi:hypothetical protein
MHDAPADGGAANHSDTLDVSLSPESASGAQEETMDRSCRAAGRGALYMSALILAGVAAAEAPKSDTSAPPDPEFLEFLGETAGVSPELIGFMESREAKRAVKDAAKNAPKQESLPAQVNRPDGVPPDRERFIADGAVRWQAMGETDRAAAHARFNTWRQLPPADREKLRERWTRFRELTLAQQAAVREAYREFLELPPEQRAAIADRWQQMSPEEQRRAIQRRQGSHPGTIDKRPCPPC